jgi:hypothetical protein
MDRLAELLRQGADKIVNFPTEAQRFLTNPQSFTELVTGKNPLPKETGFVAGATGLPAKNPVQGGVLNPASAPYQEGYEQGEPVAIAAMALPAYVTALRAGAPKVADAIGNYMVKTGGIQPMFIGPESKMWDAKSAFQAAKLEKQGVPAEEIWKQTGTGRGLDNQFRQEISDAEMKFHPETLNSLRRSREFDKLSEPWTKDTPYLYDLVEHKKLREAYPASADTTILRGSNDTGGSSSPYEWADVTLNVLPARNTREKLANIPEMESTLLHELQHQVQSAEGFAKGGNVGEFKEVMPPKDVLTRLHKLQAEFEALPSGPERWAKVKEHYDLADQYTPFGQYQRLAGEAEARMTSNRQKLTDAERKTNYPFKEGQYGLDVPLDEILIRQFNEPVVSRKQMLEQLIDQKK